MMRGNTRQPAHISENILIISETEKRPFSKREKAALTMNVRLLKTFSWSKVKVSCHLRNRFRRSEDKKGQKSNIIQQEMDESCTHGVFKLKDTRTFFPQHIFTYYSNLKT